MVVEVMDIPMVVEVMDIRMVMMMATAQGDNNLKASLLQARYQVIQPSLHTSQGIGRWRHKEDFRDRVRQGLALICRGQSWA